MTADMNFAKEFVAMMNGLKAQTGYLNLNDIPLPASAMEYFSVQDREEVLVKDITEPYFDKLNDHSHTLWGHKEVKRRKFDYKGDFVVDKNTGEIILEDVDVPHDSLAIVSDIMIGLPYNKNRKSEFIYVDYADELNSRGEKVRKYIYIIPRKYCYRLNQTALILSWSKINKNFFQQMALSLSSGHVVYMAVIPYKPSTVQKNYKILTTKIDIDYTKEVDALISFWIEKQVMFDPKDCELTEDFKGRTNMAYMNFDTTLDMWQTYDENRSMAYEESVVADLNFDVEEV